MPTEPTLPKPECVVKVGEGRGFVFEYPYEVPQSVHQQAAKLQLRGLRFRRRRWPRGIVTAAHCLPNLPPAHGAAHYWERTYKDLLSSLDGSKNNVWAECLFVDPVADIAVVGCPDGEQADAYHALVDDAPAVRIGKPRTGRAWVLTLDGLWVPTPMNVSSDMTIAVIR